MYKKIGTIIIIISALAAACSSPRHSAAPDSRYRRQPIREVTEEQLKSDAMLIDAVALVESGHTQEALDLYGRLTATDPACAAAWYGMGQILLQRGWTDSAQVCAQRAVDLNASNLWYLLSLAQVQQARADAKGLIATWQRVVDLKPEVPEYYYELSNAYVADKDINGAVDALNRLEKRIGVTEPVSLQKQRLWVAAGKMDKAMKEVESLADALPAAKRYNAILAEMNMQQQRYSKAKRYYDRILAEDPDDPYIHIQLAEYYKALNRPADADTEMIAAFRNPALDSKTKLQILGQFYTSEEFYTSRKETTFRLMDLAMAQCSDSAEFAAFYGHVLFMQEKYADAAHWFEVALARDSSVYDVWELLLVSLDGSGDTTARLDGYARRAEALFPMHTLPHFLLARNAVIASRYEEAIEPLEQAMKWGFTKGYLEAECHALMAEACYRTGRYDRAWKAFEECLKLRPDDMSTLNNYAYYLAEQHLELEKALAMSRRTIDAEPDNANSLDTYAWILHLMGRDAEALPHMQKAVELDPKSDTLRRHLDIIKESLK